MPLECIRTTGVCPDASGVHQNHCGMSQNATGVYQNHWGVSVCHWSATESMGCVQVPKECVRVNGGGGGGGGGRGGVQMLLECVRINGLCPNATGVCHSHRLSWTTGLPPSIFACVKTLLECVRCHWRVGCYPLECTRHHHWSVSDATGVGLSYWISSDATVECRVLLESVRAMSDATGVSGASHWSVPDTITGVR